MRAVPEEIDTQRLEEGIPLLFGALRVICGFFAILGALAVCGFVTSQVGIVLGLVALAAYVAVVYPFFRLLYAA